MVFLLLMLFERIGPWESLFASLAFEGSGFGMEGTEMTLEVMFASESCRAEVA